MNLFQKDLALSFLKAVILTIIVIGAIASLSSCTRVAGDTHYSNEWRGTVLKTGRPLTIKNIDSLCVMAGDTVTVFYMPSNGSQNSYYYISNTPDIACDTMSVEMIVNGKDTSYEQFEAWNVRLEKRLVR